MMKLLIIVVLLVISYPAYYDYQGGGNPALPSLLKVCLHDKIVNLQALQSAILPANILCESLRNNHRGNYFVHALAIDCIQGERR